MEAAKLINKDIIVNCTDKYVFINDTKLEVPVEVEKLKAVLGEPSQQIRGSFGWNLIWDDLGIYCEYHSWPHISHVTFFHRKTGKMEYEAKELFQGKIYINDKLYDESMPASVATGKTAVRRYQRQGEDTPHGVVIEKNWHYKEPISPDKYHIKFPKGEVIEFEDFNFKLAVIQELMFTQSVLKPKFDLFEFADVYADRKIDLEEEGYAPIPEVVQYFKDLPIEKKFASKLKKIDQNGSEIYGQVYRFWNGEDDTFNIQSAADSAQFPNLKKVVLFYDEDTKVENEFKAFEIKVSHV